MIEYVLYGTKKGEQKYMEQIITVKLNFNDLKPAFEWATNNGFDNLCYTPWGEEKPNFINSINL